MTNPKTTELLTDEELAARLKVPAKTIRNWASRRIIPAVRITRRIRRFALADVMKALESRGLGGQETEPASATADAGS